MNKRIKAIIAGTLAVVTIISTFNFKSEEIVEASEVKRAKNVIMLIADGMSTEAITLSRLVKGEPLTMDEISTGTVMTSWANGPITDSAPGGTAYSAGQKTSNKFIATDLDKSPLATMIEGAENVGKATGIIATSEITHATPADFTAHINDRSKYNSILRQQINGELEVVLGGGFNIPNNFKDVSNFDSYYLERIQEIEEEGFEFVQSKEEMNEFNGDKLWGSFAKADMKYDYDRQTDRDEDEPSLAEMTNKAIEVLNKDEDGFFLMVEGSKVDWAAHANNTVGIVSDLLAFDEAVKEAVDFAKNDGNTVVVVTTDHGNSGITIGSDYYNNNIGSYDKATFDDTVNKLLNAKITEERFNTIVKNKTDKEILALAKENYGFDLTSEELSIVQTKGIKEVIALRVGIGYTTGGHTGEEIYLGVYAPSGVRLLEGVVDNIEVNKYMQEVFFGTEILSTLTAEIFKDGEKTLTSIDGTTVTINEEVAHNPKVVVERSGNIIELELYTNNYMLNGERKELKTVMPYIDGKFYIPDELVSIVSNLEQVDEQYNYYFGDFHNHTGYSDGKYGSTPSDAFSYAYDQGDVDFMVLTDHSSMINEAEWTDTVQTANSKNQDGRFVAIAGYEQTQYFGHMNVFNLNSEDKPINDANMENWYETLKGMPYALAQFNHPDGIDYGDFDKFKYDAELDSIINLYEIGCGDSSIEDSDYYLRWSRFDTYYNQYFNALDKGWHVAPVNNQDNHRGSWYALNECRAVVLAEELTREGIFEAVRNRRLYATEDKNQKIDFTINNEVMGSILENPSQLKANISVNDPDSKDIIDRVEILGDGGNVVASQTEINSTVFEWDLDIDNKDGNRYFVVRVVKADGGISITSPIWTGLEFDEPQEPQEREITIMLSKDEISNLGDTLDVSLGNLRQPSKGSDWVGVYEADITPGSRPAIWWKWLDNLGVDSDGKSNFTINLNDSEANQKYRLEPGKEYKVVVLYGAYYDSKVESKFTIAPIENIEDNTGGNN